MSRSHFPEWSAVAFALLLAVPPGVARAEPPRQPTGPSTHAQEALEGSPYVDPRYPFTLEASGIVAYLSSVDGFGGSEASFGGGLTFGLPVGERRQIVLLAEGAKGSSNSGQAWFAGGAAGYRIMTYADPWRTRLDLQLAADYSEFYSVLAHLNRKHTEAGFGLGVRAAVGIQYFFLPGVGAGLDVAASAYTIKTHFLLAIGPTVTANW